MADDSNTAPNPRPIAAAVLGYGLAGRVFHCPFISAVPGLKLKTILQRSGTEAAAAYPEAQVVRTLEEVLSDSEIELVVVATPNETHVPFAEQVLLAGKHCVVDKPFAATSKEAAALVELSHRQASLLVPFHNRRFDGDFLTVKKLLAEGTLGHVVEISSRFDRYRPMLRESSWKEQAGPMSGLLFDLGTHLIDQALALFGTPDTIAARVYRDRQGTSIDDGFDLTLEYRQRGLRYRCGSTLLAAEASPRFRVNGTMGSYVKFGVDPQEAAVGSGERPPFIGSKKEWLPEPKSAWGTLTLPRGTAPTVTLESQPLFTQVGDYRKFYENVTAALHRDAKLAITPEDGYRSIRMLEFALQSDAQGRTVQVEL